MMISLEDTLVSDEYDEFGLLHENAAEWDIPFTDPPLVSRHCFVLQSGQGISYLRWGEGEPELVLLHGIGQCAHTWDTLLLALGRPAIAVDLPGHGLSDWRRDGDYGPWRNAESVASLMESVAPLARVVVGMSLGAATTIRLAAQYPGLCRRAVYIDTTPQLNDPARTFTTSDRGAFSLLSGPPVYDSFDELADAVVTLSRYRSESHARRALRHVMRRLNDGKWTMRCDPLLPGPGWNVIGDRGRNGTGSNNAADFRPLWRDVSDTKVPALLVRGELSPFVRDEDVEEMCRRHPSLEVTVIESSGHSVQGDQPLALAASIRDFAL